MPRPTRDDAVLLMQLANWNTANGVPEATNWIHSKDFVKDFDKFERRFPDGSKGRLHVSRFLGFYETVGTLWKNHLLSEELLLDWLWVAGGWDLVGDIAIGMRKKSGVDALWENFEALAERQLALTSGPRKRSAPGSRARTRAPAKQARKRAPAKQARKRAPAKQVRKATTRSSSARRR